MCRVGSLCRCRGLRGDSRDGRRREGVRGRELDVGRCDRFGGRWEEGCESLDGRVFLLLRDWKMWCERRRSGVGSGFL